LVVTQVEQDDVRHRIYSVETEISEIRRRCRVASITVGVLHEGETVFTKGFGYRDVENELPADEDSLYMLASVSKSFLAAAVGILVHDEKLKWTDPIRKYVPEFNPHGDQRIGKEANFIHILRHSGGLSNPVVSVLGPHGTVLLPSNDFIELVNVAPTGNEGHNYFEESWQYSNVGYGLVAKAVEAISGMRYAGFIQKRILEPLGLRRTVVTESDVSNDENIAFPYVQLKDGTWKKLSHEWTSEHNTPILAAFGKRSSVKDLLLWCAATMWAEVGDRGDAKPGILRTVERNPLKEMRKIRTGSWTRPHNDRFQNQSEYCLGWFRAVLPSSQVT
jgi:CubicO group peptidase (beta-lactamase class C family)